MVQTIDASAPSRAAKFYDRFAADYDRMTRFEKRFDRERPFFEMLLQRYPIHRAIDAGCGSGFHALLLSQLGVEMTATDVSAEMIERTKSNASKLQLTLTTLHATFAELPMHVPGSFDAVFCLGNTLPHLTDDGELHASLSAFSTILHSGGTLFIQLLNYHRILKTKPRVLNVTHDESCVYVRFYDYHSSRIDFNILSIDTGKASPSHDLITIPLRPFVLKELLPALHSSGFDSVETFGGITLKPFVPDESIDLFLISTKQREPTGGKHG